MKRNGAEVTIDSISMANCLMMLARGGGGGFEAEMMTTTANSAGRTFECKTCNRQFPSFQALGGHRASHKKPKLMGIGLGLGGEDTNQQLQMKPKTHECSICGLEFAIGQALGGHMRRHRTALIGEGACLSLPPPPATATATATHVAVLKKSQSRRILCLDLNLTPFENGIGLEFPLGMISPVPSVIA